MFCKENNNYTCIRFSQKIVFHLFSYVKQLELETSLPTISLILPFKYIINIYYYFSLQNLILEAIKQWSIRLDFIFSFAKDTKYHICTSNKIFHS